MLILTREQGESIVIGDAVEIVVLGMKGGHVRIGINAPRQVKILRGELRDEISDSRSKSDSDRHVRGSFGSA